MKPAPMSSGLCDCHVCVLDHLRIVLSAARRRAGRLRPVVAVPVTVVYMSLRDVASMLLRPFMKCEPEPRVLVLL